MKLKSIYSKAKNKNKESIIVNINTDNWTQGGHYAIDENGERIDADTLFELALSNRLIVKADPSVFGEESELNECVYLYPTAACKLTNEFIGYGTITFTTLTCLLADNAFTIVSKEVPEIIPN